MANDSTRPIVDQFSPSNLLDRNGISLRFCWTSPVAVFRVRFIFACLDRNLRNLPDCTEYPDRTLSDGEFGCGYSKNARMKLVFSGPSRGNFTESRQKF